MLLGALTTAVTTAVHSSRRVRTLYPEFAGESCFPNMRYAHVLGTDVDCNTGLVYYTSWRFRGSYIKLNAGCTSTILASYIARIRGTGEPELSMLCTNELDHFLRECNAFVIEHGSEHRRPENDARIDALRERFETVLRSMMPGYVFG